MTIIAAYIEAAKVPAAEGSERAKRGTDRSLVEVLPRSSFANCKQQVHVPVGTVSSEGASRFLLRQLTSQPRVSEININSWHSRGKHRYARRDLSDKVLTLPTSNIVRSSRLD